MVKVLFMCGLIIGAVIGWYICIGVVTRCHIGTLRMIFVGDHFERASLEFEDQDAKSKAQNKLKFGLVKIERKIIEDPDTQEIQGV